MIVLRALSALGGVVTPHAMAGLYQMQLSGLPRYAHAKPIRCHPCCVGAEDMTCQLFQDVQLRKVVDDFHRFQADRDDSLEQIDDVPRVVGPVVGVVDDL